jgi:hypothetical protein
VPQFGSAAHGAAQGRWRSGSTNVSISASPGAYVPKITRNGPRGAAASSLSCPSRGCRPAGNGVPAVMSALGSKQTVNCQRKPFLTNCYSKTRRVFNTGGCTMKCSKPSFFVVVVFFAGLLSLSSGTLYARDADSASTTFAAAQTVKQRCISTCRARYRDCRRLNQLPSFECRGVYRDCTRYSCTGLGPG